MALRAVCSRSSQTLGRTLCLHRAASTWVDPRKLKVDLKGTTACVTGASQGFGRAIADRLAEFGSNVIYSDRNVEPLLADAALMADAQRRVVECDVTRSESVKAMFTDAVGHFGRLDIIVCNAGVLWSSRIEAITAEEWRKTMAVNVDGVFHCVQHAIPYFKQQQYGRVITIGSSAGRSVSTVGGMHYTASKAAVLGITRAAAKELAVHGVTVNSVCPGLFETEMVTENIDKWGKSREEYEAAFPVNRLGQPVEVADTVCFLASEHASYITGACIDINGGDLMM